MDLALSPILFAAERYKDQANLRLQDCNSLWPPQLLIIYGISRHNSAIDYPYYSAVMRRHETKLFHANKNGIICGHDIAITYRRTSTVVYVHNITCATIHNKMIFDWKYRGGKAAQNKRHTQPKIYGHDTEQTHTREPKKPMRMTQSWHVFFLKLVANASDWLKFNVKYTSNIKTPGFHSMFHSFWLHYVPQSSTGKILWFQMLLFFFQKWNPPEYSCLKHPFRPQIQSHIKLFSPFPLATVNL